MLKKFVRPATLLVTVIILCLFAASCAGGVSDDKGLVYAEDKDLGGYIVTGYKGTSGDVVIPAEYNGKPVIAIADGAFSSAEAKDSIIKSVSVPASVTKIGAVAFKNCAKLETVTFEGSSKIETISTGLFTGCEALTSITIPAGVKIIGYKAFENCKALASANLPAGIELIDNYAFSGCEALTAMTIDGDEFTIRANAFKGCVKLSALSTPADDPVDAEYKYSKAAGVLTDTTGKTLVRVLEVKDGSFAISAGIENISKGAFFGIFDLKEITAEGSAYFTAEDGVLYSKDMKKLIAFPAGKEVEGKKYTVKTGVEEIEVRAFSGTENLTDITLPDSVKTIGAFAFSKCIKLENFTVGSGEITAGENIFYDCTELGSYKLPDLNISYKIKDRIFYTDSDTADDTEVYDLLVSYPAEVTATSFEIPAFVVKIAPGAFSLNSSLTTITVAADNKNFSAEDGVLYNLEKTEVIACPAGKAGTVKLAATASKLSDGAFAGNDKLELLIIPADTVSFGKEVFTGCSALTEVKFAGSKATWDNSVSTVTANDKTTLNRVNVSCGYAG